MLDTGNNNELIDGSHDLSLFYHEPELFSTLLRLDLLAVTHGPILRHRAAVINVHSQHHRKEISEEEARHYLNAFTARLRREMQERVKIKRDRLLDAHRGVERRKMIQDMAGEVLRMVGEIKGGDGDMLDTGHKKE